MYLYQATILSQRLMSDGLYEFFVSVFNIDKGRVPLLLIVVQPAFVLFGPSLDAAVITLNLFWFVLLWAVSGISRNFPGVESGEKAAFFAFSLFAFYPLTVLLAHNYLVELMLVACVTASIYSLLMLYESGRLRWSISAGVWIGAGLLTKVTFPAFVFPAFLILVLLHARRASIRSAARVFCPAVMLPLIIAGPYYVYNLKDIFHLTALLSSHGLSQLYGFRSAFDPVAIFEYLWVVFTNPVMLVAFLCIGLSWAAAFFNKKRVDGIVHASKVRKGPWLVVLALWFFIPLVLATIGEIKEPRYAYAALIPIFVLAGIGAARRQISFFGALLMLCFYVVALPAYLRVNDFLDADRFDAFRISSGLTTDSLIDERDWRVGPLVKEISESLPATDRVNSVLFLGGNRYYHMRLFDYYGLMGGLSLRYFALPYYARPDMTVDEALSFIDKEAPDGIISKSGQNWPEFSSRLDASIIRALDGNPRYRRINLSTTQPDGSVFSLFVRKPPEYLRAVSSAELVGSWSVMGGVARIEILAGGEVLITTETGAKGAASIREGSIFVPAWNVSGRITSDLKTLHWDNGSRWERMIN